MSRSVIERIAGGGFSLSGSTGSATSTVVRDAVPSTFQQAGINNQSDTQAGLESEATFEGVVLERMLGPGVRIASSVATIDHLVVRDVSTYGDGSFGRGVSIQPDPGLAVPSTVTLRSALVERYAHAGLVTIGSTVDATGLALRDGLAGAPFSGVGLVATIDPTSSGLAELTCLGCSLTGNRSTAADSHGATLTLDGTVIRETFPETNGYYQGNTCGCAGEVDECKVVTVGVEPPAPLPPTDVELE